MSETARIASSRDVIRSSYRKETKGCPALTNSSGTLQDEERIPDASMARMPQVFRIALAMIFLLSFHATAWAQATGTISGTVEDETGAVLPGVSVSVSVSVAGAPAIPETVTDMT